VGRLGVAGTSGEIDETELAETIDRFIDRQETQLFNDYLALADSDRLRRRLEGDLPLGQRQTLAKVVFSFVRARAVPLLESQFGSQLFSAVPETTFKRMVPYFYREISQRPTSEAHFKSRYRPVVLREAYRYPEVLFTDHLRARLQRGSVQHLVHAQAAQDLMTLLGMAIEVGGRERQQ